MVYDCIIIGAGPAGMAASVYLARQKLNFIILSKDVGGQTLLSADVENYLGFHLIDGVHLVEKFKEHLNDYKIELRQGISVNDVVKENNFIVKTDDGDFEGKTVLIATGEKHRELNVPGEKEYYGKGLSYCATCDVPLFADKIIAVVGGGNSALDAALFALKYCPKVYIVNLNDKLTGDKGMLDNILNNSKVEVVNNAKTKEIIGDKFVNGVKLEVNGQERILDVNGVFVEIGLMPASGFINIVEKDKWGEIIVDKRNQTNVPGIFAAGDVTDITEKQIIVAAGEGGKASLEIIKYLQSKN